MSEQWHGGKGSKYRPANLIKLAEFWKRYCDNHGHRYVNRRCIYCGKASMEQEVTIKESEYAELKKDQQLLHALQAAGVDNWDGYDYAIDMLGDTK